VPPGVCERFLHDAVSGQLHPRVERRHLPGDNQPLATVEGLLPLAVQEWLMRVTPVAAFSVIQSVPAYHQVSTQYSPAFGYFPLAWWAGFAVLCAWAVVALAGAAYVLRRRDV
jgi:hypothetical protein